MTTLVLVRELDRDGRWAGRTEGRVTLASPDRAAAMAWLVARGPVRVVDAGRRTVDVLGLSF